MYVEAEYFVFGSIVPDFVKSFGDVTKDYVCGLGVCVLLGVGYDSTEDAKVSVRPLTSPESVLVVVVEVV